MLLADILIFRGVSSLYTYIIPESLNDKIRPGQVVSVPFGKSKSKGLVFLIEEKSIEKRTLKPIHTIEEKYPTLSTELLKFIEWFWTHYQTTPYKAYQTIIGLKKERELPEEKKAPVFETPYPLTEEQEKTITSLSKHLNTFHEALLHGVTSSGKTEVYIQLAQKTIQAKQSALLLVPEIALTPQFTRVFKERFGETIAIFHSGLTQKEKEVEWNKVLKGQTSIAIGPRSAIFLPFKKIGLIIIDEEHENTYKQESHPRYLTHTIAKYRAKEHHCLLVYGSATPSIETYHDAKSKKIETYQLKKRVNKKALPIVEIVDMQLERHLQNTQCLSRKLENEIQETLAKKEKVMILLNRRGYAPYISCSKCGKIHECPKCTLSYTYHKDKSLRCHRCHSIKPATHYCSSCKKNSLQFTGSGSQKLEIELQKTFPEANILRLDKDTGKKSRDIEDILTTFKNEGDILVGTQMIAKGHHIEEVTLVGVLNIDATLNLPDFRSPERTFQLLTQVAGRAGRGKKSGKVIIQTYQQDHYAIDYAKTHNYEQFYEEEIEYREQLWYPAFSKLVNIICSSKKEHNAKKAAKDLYLYLESKTKDNTIEKTQLIGPKPAPIEKVQNYFRWNILIKTNNEDHIKNILAKAPEQKYTRVIIDYDPRSIL